MKNAVEVKTIEHGQGRLLGVRRKADEADESLFASLQGGLDRAAPTEDRVGFPDIHQAVELVEVKVGGMQELKRFVESGGCSPPCTVLSLAG